MQEALQRLSLPVKPVHQERSLFQARKGLLGSTFPPSKDTLSCCLLNSRTFTVAFPDASSPRASIKVYVEVIVNSKPQVTHMNLKLSINII